MPLYANSIYLMLNTALTAMFGLVFWVVAARLYPTDVVGQGSAVVSVAAFLTFVAGLGFGIGLIRFLPTAGTNSADLINSCFTISGIASFVATAVFLGGLYLWAPALHFVRDEPIFIVAFIIFIAAATLFSLLDGVFIGMRRANFTLAKNVVQNVLRVGLAVIMASFFGVFGIFASWGLAMLVALVLGIVLLMFVLPNYRPVPNLQRQVSNEMLHFSSANYVSNGLWCIPGWLFPVMVLNQLGEDVNAYFFVSWAMASILFAIPAATSTSLLVEGSHQENPLGQDVSRSVKLTILLLLPSVAVMLFFGHWVLLVFGSDYSHEGTKLLWLLSISAFPYAVNQVYMSIARVRKKHLDVILVAGAAGLGSFVLGYLLIPTLGILGPGIAWLAGNSVVALVVIPRITTLIKSQPAMASNNAVDDSEPALVSAGKAGSTVPDSSITLARRASGIQAVGSEEGAQATEQKPGQKVLAAYYRGVSQVEKHTGEKMSPSCSPREFLRRVQAKGPGKSFASLTALAEKALYSGLPVTEEEARYAAELATQMEGEFPVESSSSPNTPE